MIRKIKNFFTGLYIRFRGRPSRLKRAIRRADRLHRQTGKRYRVFFFGYRFVVWTRQDIKERKRIGLFRSDKKAGADFDTICFYDTQKTTPCS
ncbi:MAG: hypothetical protein LBS05_00085 [Tannerellaceae bacterium]|jgi:hypothetical protein|nr:hypothetical protein [Tannerellaceae bacterium]